MTGVLRSVNAIRIFTRDLDRARRFYGDVLDLEQSAQGPDYVVFDLAGVDIVVEAVALDDPEGSDLVGRLIAASFRVDDVESAYRHLNARCVSFLRPRRPSNGEARWPLRWTPTIT